jgi:hypothetical protein
VPLHVVPDKDWNEKAFIGWFKKHKPEVIVTHHESVLEWLARSGTKVPEETGVIHLNCPEATGKWSGIFQNGPSVGMAAVDFLVAMLHRNERGIPALPHTILVEGTWVEGKTLLPKTAYAKPRRNATARREVHKRR